MVGVQRFHLSHRQDGCSRRWHQSRLYESASRHGRQGLYSTRAYSKVNKHELLDFIHNLDGENGKKLLPMDLGLPDDFPLDHQQTVVFKETSPGKTEVTITEYGWTPGQMMEISKIGMNTCLVKMAASFRKKVPRDHTPCDGIAEA